MRNRHGDFIWYELMTSDVEGAARFYGSVLGWKATQFGDPALDYRVLETEEAGVAGMLAISSEAAECGMRPMWLGYVGVDDVDRAVADIVEAGGRVNMAAMDVPEVGRMAMVADPSGVSFYVMRGAVDDVSHSFSSTKAGHCRWNQLETDDPAGALAFYGERFGWVESGVFPMGPMGDYRLLALDGTDFGGVMKRPANVPESEWFFYFGVDDIDVAAKAVVAAGGTVLHPPDQVPSGDFVFAARDPQGARFGLSGGRR